jgi:hypothetical protein
MRAEILATAALGLLACSSSEVEFSTGSVAVGASPTRVVVRDFNRDGVADLAVTTYRGARLYLVMGRGDGTFEPPVPVVPAWDDQSDRWCETTASGDFDGDGWPDLAAACESAVIVFRNLGDGSFEPVEDIAVSARDLGAADFNGDQRDELIIVPEDGYSAMIHSVSGVLPRIAVDLPTYGALTAAAADFDQDGSMDIVVSSGDSFNVTYSVADAEKMHTRGFASAPEPNKFAIGDFNRDGAPDIALTSFFSVYVLSVYLNDGSGGFVAHGTYPGSGKLSILGDPIPSDFGMGDVNGDGIPDLVFCPDFTRLRLLTGLGDGTFAYNRAFASDVGWRHIAVADLNGDGQDDIATTSLSIPFMLTVLLSR